MRFNRPSYIAFIDGSFVPDLRRGGWAVMIINRISGHSEYHSGVEYQVNSHQRMELSALRHALEHIPGGSHVKIVTDSLMIEKVLPHLEVYQAANWQSQNPNKDRRIANWDLWEQVYDLSRGQKLSWERVKRNSLANMRAVDALAYNEAQGTI